MGREAVGGYIPPEKREGETDQIEHMLEKPRGLSIVKREEQDSLHEPFRITVPLESNLKARGTTSFDKIETVINKVSSSGEISEKQRVELTAAVSNTVWNTPSDALIYSLHDFVEKYVSTDEHDCCEVLRKNGERGDDALLTQMLTATARTEKLGQSYPKFVDSVFVSVVNKLIGRLENQKGKNVNSLQFREYDKNDKYVAFDDQEEQMNERNNLDSETCVASEFRMMNQCILFLAEYGSRDTVDNVIKLAEQYGSSVTMHIARACERIDAPYAAKCMLEKVRAPKKDNETEDQLRYRVSMFSRLLYRLELGKVGISDNVVTYLEKQYDLQNSEEGLDFARRITGDGKIGLFDKDGALQGFIELGDLGDGEKQRQAKVLEVSRDLLFSDPNTPDEIRQQFLKEYTNFYEHIFGEKGSVRMSDLTLREQVWMYQYSKNTAPEDWGKIGQLKEEFGIDGVKVFIAGEQNADIGKRILAFVENTAVERATKERLFRAYGAIVSELDFVGQRTKDFFKNSTEQELDTRAVTNEMAKRAYRILDNAMSSYEGGNDTEATDRMVQAVRRDVVSFAAIFKTLFKGKEHIDISLVRGLDLETKQATELSNIERKQMEEIAYTNFATGDTKARALFEGLQSSLQDDRNTFYLLKKQKENSEKGVEEDIVAFVRFMPPDDRGHRYAGSFNVNPAYRGSGIGEAMLENALKKEAEKCVLDATVYDQLAVGTNYIEKQGFTIVGAHEDFHGTGETHFKIQWDNKKNATLETRTDQQWSHENIAKKYKEYSTSWVEQFEAGQKVVIAKHSAEKDRFDVRQMVMTLTNNGYEGTRYFIDPENSDLRYYVFERNALVSPSLS